MKKKNILGKVALSPFYILKGIWEWSGQMEDEPQEDNNVTCKYCGLDFPSVKHLVFGDCIFHPDVIISQKMNHQYSSEHRQYQ